MLGNLANCVADPDNVCLAICAFASRTVDLEGCTKVSEPDEARDLAADAKALSQSSCDFARPSIIFSADIGIRVTMGVANLAQKARMIVSRCQLVIVARPDVALGTLEALQLGVKTRSHCKIDDRKCAACASPLSRRMDSTGRHPCRSCAACTVYFSSTADLFAQHYLQTPALNQRTGPQ